MCSLGDDDLGKSSMRIRPVKDSIWSWVVMWLVLALIVVCTVLLIGCAAC
jgi:hypothetical protein